MFVWLPRIQVLRVSMYDGISHVPGCFAGSLGRLSCFFGFAVSFLNCVQKLLRSKGLMAAHMGLTAG